MLEDVLSTPHLYFSYTSDLTRSLQSKWDQHRERRAAESGADGSEAGSEEGPFGVPADPVALFTRWDERFVWNRQSTRLPSN